MICLSFDTDHVDEARMREFLGRVEVFGRATFFCTSRYECLEDLDAELCGHPYLDEDRSWLDVLRATRSEFPDALGWRSHSCVYSHLLGVQLAAEGYVYTSTQAELGRESPKPFREPWGLWQVPIYYMDNLDFSVPRFWPAIGHTPFRPELIEAALNGDGVFVFDFHPVHLLLNSPSAEWYLEHREAFARGVRLDEVRYAGYGANDFYDELHSAMRTAGIPSHALIDSIRLEPEKLILAHGDA